MFVTYNMGDDIRKKILFLFIISVPYLYPQAWFPLEVGYKYQFMKKTWQVNDLQSPHWEFELYHIEVLSDTMISDQKYFKTSRYPDTWIRHDCRDSKTYIYWDTKDHLFMNYALPADTLFEHMDPDSKSLVEVLVLDSTKFFAGEDRIMKGYRNFELSPAGFTDLYFSPDIGFFNIYHQHEILGEGVTTINYDLLGAQFTLTHYTDGYLPQIIHTPLPGTSDSIITFYTTVNHFHNHIFPAGSFDIGINYVDTVYLHSRYQKNGLIIENPKVVCESIPFTADWFANIELDLNLMADGHIFEYYFEALDKALIPAHTISPDSGYFTLIYAATVVNDNQVIQPAIEVVQNYPNPFNPITTISYTLNKRNLVSINVFDILGTKVAELINEDQSAGDYKLQFNGSDLPSGVYFCRMNAGVNYCSIKLILIK